MEEVKSRISFLLSQNQEGMKRIYQKEEKALEKIEQMEKKLLSLISQREESLLHSLDSLKLSFQKSLDLESQELEAFLESLSFSHSFGFLILSENHSSSLYSSVDLLFPRLKSLLSSHHLLPSTAVEEIIKCNVFSKKDLTKTLSLKEIVSINPSDLSFVEDSSNLKQTYCMVNHDVKVFVKPVDFSNQPLDSGNFSEHFRLSFTPPENIKVCFLSSSSSFFFFSLSSSCSNNIFLKKV